MEYGKISDLFKEGRKMSLNALTNYLIEKGLYGNYIVKGFKFNFKDKEYFIPLTDAIDIFEDNNVDENICNLKFLKYEVEPDHSQYFPLWTHKNINIYIDCDDSIKYILLLAIL